MRDRPTRGRGRLVLLALSLLLLAGCSLAIREPEVRVARVGLTSLGFTGGTVEVVLQVSNPNGFDLEARAFRYALAFPEPAPDGDTTWVPLTEEERRDTVLVPARDTAFVPLRLPFELQTVGLAAGRLLRQGELGYRFSGTVRLQTPLGGVEVPFERRGSIAP